MEAVLVVNAGSSSVKFQAFSVEGPGVLQRRIRGQIDGIGTAPRLKASGGDGGVLIDQSYDATEVRDVSTALIAAGAWLREHMAISLIAVGHRVVHGGPDYSAPVLIDRKVLADLERLIPLAPLHQPNNLAPIGMLLARSPEMPQVACFDTAFHRGHDALADRYAIPERFYTEGVRRYGFHGLSYEYIARKLHEVAPQVADGRVVVAHLGSGASLCALAKGRSVESTMGFTALDGLPMGTRSGQIDPGLVLYLIMQEGMSARAVQQLLYNESGLKGLSGISNDVRALETSTAPRARFALDYFAYRVGLHAGMLAASLGGIDAFVFTAGIGENSATMRARIAERLEWLGADLDPEANAAGETRISRPRSEVALYVIPTDEELMIAQHTLSLISRNGRVRRQDMKVAAS
jgi:acetate kinase